MVGKTSIVELVNEFNTCKFVLGCDSGGVHLANACGVKVYVLFGPTNPLVTVPCFNASKIIIQSSSSPETGGCDINLLTPEEVFNATKNEL